MNKKHIPLFRSLIPLLFVFQLAACGGGKSSPPGNNTGSVTLSWQPPSKNTNNSILTNLVGYKIYYGTSPLLTTNIIAVTDPNVSTYVVNGLNTGVTYYFVITAVNNVGVESSYSNTTSKAL